MMRRLLSLVLLLVVMFVTTIAGSSTSRAQPPDCGNSAHVHLGGDWQPTNNRNAYGVRGPVQARRDGTVCTQAGNHGGPEIWLGIQNGTEANPGNKLVQIGFIYYYDTQAKASKFCLFYENYPAELQQLVNCNSNANQNDVYEWVKIETNGQYYDIRDCGVSDPDFSSCGTPLEQVQVFNSAFGTALGEADPGSCDHEQIFGDSSDPDNIGSDTYPWQGKYSSSDTWSAKTLDDHYDGPSCYHYQYFNPSGTVGGLTYTYDTLNGS